MNYQSFSEISLLCEKYNITNYSVNKDSSIDVNGNVDIKGKLFWDNFGDAGSATALHLYGKKHNYTLDKIPLNFRHVTGDFDCRYNKITTLDGCPKYVGGNFYISNNLIESLNKCPKEVDRFLAGNNLFEDLEGSPRVVRGDFNVSGEYDKFGRLMSLKGGPISVGGYYSFAYNPMLDVTGFPQNFSSGDNLRKDGASRNSIGFQRTGFSEVLNLLYECDYCNDINCNHVKDNKLINFFINEINRYKVIEDDVFYISRFEQMYYDLIDNDTLYLKQMPPKIELESYKII